MFDGHGPWGHVIAKRVKKSFPSSLLCQWQQTLASLSSSPECSSPLDLWKQACLKTFSVIDLDLKINPSLDSYCSGCTALTAVLQVHTYNTYVLVTIQKLFITWYLILDYVLDTWRVFNLTKC